MTAAEFHRPFVIHDLPSNGRRFSIEARAEERTALAGRMGIVAVNLLAAEGSLRPEAGASRVRLSAQMKAEVVQTCVVTLEPFSAVLVAPIERLYALDADFAWEDDDHADLFVDLSDDLVSEPCPQGVIDLGEVTAEQLALELDPYPRAPGAVFVAKTGTEDTEALPSDDGNHPFDLLRFRRGGRGG